MPNINKNIIMQGGAAVANATNKAAGLSASTPEPGSIISAIQLVNGGREIGPTALAHFTESVRNKLLSLLVNMELIQSGSGTPSPDNVRPISGRTGLTIYVSPIPDAADATTYAVDWTTQAGTVYGGTVDVVTGVLTVNRYIKSFTGTESYTNYTSVIQCNETFPVGLSVAGSDILCSHSTNQYVHFSNSSKNKVQFDKATFGVTSVDELKAKLAAWSTNGEPLQYSYELATPLTYQLSAQDVVTLVGDNYIWSDSGDVTITE